MVVRRSVRPFTNLVAQLGITKKKSWNTAQPRFLPVLVPGCGQSYGSGLSLRSCLDSTSGSPSRSENCGQPATRPPGGSILRRCQEKIQTNSSTDSMCSPPFIRAHVDMFNPVFWFIARRWLRLLPEPSCTRSC